MAKEKKCVLEIGSSCVKLTGVEIINGNVGRSFFKTYRHDGIKNNFFVNPEKLMSVIEKTLSEYEDAECVQLKEVYLILPQRFFRFSHETNSIAIKNGVVNKFDVADLIDYSLQEVEDCEKLKCVPIAFMVKDDYVDNPIGQECAEMSMVSVSEGILVRINEFFNDISKRLDIKFIYVPIMEPVLDKLQNELATNRSSRVAIYFSENFIDVCYCEMKAVIAEKTIEVGNADFVGALAELNKTDYDTARELLGHINFNLDGGKYVVSGTETHVFDVNEVNSGIKKLYSYLAEEIKKALSVMIGDAILPIYCAGEEIACVRGADGLLTEKLGMPVTVLTPDVLLWNTPADYAMAGLVEKLLKND